MEIGLSGLAFARSNLQPQLIPNPIDPRLHVIGHADEFGEVSVVAVFAGPFVGAVESDLAAESFNLGSVVKLVNGPA